MKDDFEKFFEGAKNVRLSDKEHASLRRVLASFIAEHPVRAGGLLGHIWERPSFAITHYELLRPMPIVLLIALLVASGGGVSLAAEKALPGDALYSIKVSVNEEVRAALAFSPQVKAAWETERAGRRLEEAEILAKQKSLGAKVSENIEANFEAHAKRAKDHMDELAAHGNAQAAAELNSNFEASLRAHGEILLHLSLIASSTNEKDKHGLDRIRKKVKAREEDAVNDRHDAELKLSSDVNADVRAAAEGRLKAAEHKIAEVQMFIDAMQLKLGATTTLDAKARLAVASSTVANGKVKLAAGAFTEAFQLFQQAHRIAQEAKLLIAAHQDFDLDIHLGVASSTDDDLHGDLEGDEHGNVDEDRRKHDENDHSPGENEDKHDSGGKVHGSGGIDFHLKFHPLRDL